MVFDFDYTLADSSDGIIDSTNYALSRLGLPEADGDAIRRTIGLSREEALVTLAGESNRCHAAEFHRLFVERADEVMVDSTRVYEFVPGILDALREANVPTGIVSQKFRRMIEHVLKREGLDGRICAILGGEDLPNLKPDPCGLLTVIERLGCWPSESVYVGDTVTDAETARRAHVPFVAALSGVTPRESFEGLPVLDVIPDASHIIGVMNKRVNSL